MSRGPFLLIKGRCEPLGVEDCKQSSSTVAGKSHCLLLHCQVVIKEGLREAARIWWKPGIIGQMDPFVLVIIPFPSLRL
jgi:hypothetical protein